MDNWFFVLLILAIWADIVLLARLRGMKKGIRRVRFQLNNIENCDTNTLLTVSAGGSEVRELAALLNRELRHFRDEEQRFIRGDNDVKEAVTNISHDLRTPITAISGYLELLEREEKSETVERYIGIISERCTALKSLTEELFDYSVTASKADSLQFTQTSLNEELEVALASFYGALTEAGIEPEISITEQKVVRSLDREAVQRIFGNIINNALKYSDGDLIVKLKDDGTVIFANTATNLSPVEAGRLFERFYTVRTAKGSTGLGLSIAKMLTAKMNGNIHAEYNNGLLEIIIRFPEPGGRS